jgi:hypothetical protein
MKTFVFVLALALAACATDGEVPEHNHPQAAAQVGAAKSCEACSNDRDCAAGLACDHSAWVCRSPGQRKQVQQGIPQCAADCAALCAAQGACGIQNGQCRPRSSADCAAALICAGNGNCTRVDDPSSGPTCRATSDADCAKNDPCRKRGKACKYSPSAGACL